MLLLFNLPSQQQSSVESKPVPSQLSTPQRRWPKNVSQLRSKEEGSRLRIRIGIEVRDQGSGSRFGIKGQDRGSGSWVGNEGQGRGSGSRGSGSRVGIVGRDRGSGSWVGIEGWDQRSGQMIQIKDQGSGSRIRTKGPGPKIRTNDTDQGSGSDCVTMLWHSDRRNPHDCHSHPLLARKVSHHRDHSIHLLPKISAIRGRICHYFMTNFHTQYCFCHLEPPDLRSYVPGPT